MQIHLCWGNKFPSLIEKNIWSTFHAGSQHSWTLFTIKEAENRQAQKKEDRLYLLHDLAQGWLRLLAYFLI